LLIVAASECFIAAEFFGYVCVCDCKQIGKFLYRIIMSEVKVSNVSAKKSTQTETTESSNR